MVRKATSPYLNRPLRAEAQARADSAKRKRAHRAPYGARLRNLTVMALACWAAVLAVAFLLLG